MAPRAVMSPIRRHLARQQQKPQSRSAMYMAPMHHLHVVPSYLPAYASTKLHSKQIETLKLLEKTFTIIHMKAQHKIYLRQVLGC